MYQFDLLALFAFSTISYTYIPAGGLIIAIPLSFPFSLGLKGSLYHSCLISPTCSCIDPFPASRVKASPLLNLSPTTATIQPIRYRATIAFDIVLSTLPVCLVPRSSTFETKQRQETNNKRAREGKNRYICSHPQRGYFRYHLFRLHSSCFASCPSLDCKIAGSGKAARNRGGHYLLQDVFFTEVSLLSMFFTKTHVSLILVSLHLERFRADVNANWLEIICFRSEGKNGQIKLANLHVSDSQPAFFPFSLSYRD
ncbi:uncharacterized protein MCYG_01458 [Microsporum canis CBS 113480]|uniref:Uncharacterized protein n=1 Tax=Arthroderma otae (strain ATCC MYA-4605 / CBS 113480) TaxID=554155 RepID=C5FH09_ARTOC|nr:uncharacterized protein MCYG_01458 [Microsporum canis CBS 113480]EEQ28639.1 predicted protein [Microsporum canis CBS 113480]